MKQLRPYAFRVDEGDVLARTLLEARAGQVPFIHGYTVDMSFVTLGGYFDNQDELSGAVMLQANPQSPTTPFNMNTDPWLALVNHQGNIGGIAKQVSILRNSGGGEAFITAHNYNWSTGYMPCGFEVPGLWVVGQHSAIGSPDTRLVATVTLHFDWVNRTSIEIAALYTTYGIDSVDATEREATSAGEIRFGQTVAGEHDLPTLIS